MGLSDRCLVSQEIRRLIERGVIGGEISEPNIQPSSFEPTLGSECYVLDTEGGLFHPRADKTIWRTLLEIPKRQRAQVDISGGYELKRGGTYLFPLNETLKADKSFRFVRSSPKSSIGRLFSNTRLLTDFNSSFDEATNFPSKVELKQWLLVQPLAFNLIAGSGLTFNQLRFFAGYDSRMSPSEVIRLWGNHPLLYEKDFEGKLGAPRDPRLSEALQLHLDLEGRSSDGIVALRTRKNPNPIDLREKGTHSAEDFFEPLKATENTLILKPGEHYLLASEEVLQIPNEINSELLAHSHQGINGPLHRAGFVDNGFLGDLVFEVTSEEPTDVCLFHRMPIGELAVYKTKVPDKLYGSGIGSHYFAQTGPKPSKHFCPFDFAAAAKNHARLNRDVLVQDKMVLSRIHGPEQFNFITAKEKVREVFDLVEGGFFHSRYNCEDDGLVLQPIPYILLFDEKGRVFSYVREGKEDDGTRGRGDVRLYGKHTVGIGGHLIRGDAPDYIRSGVNREIYKDVRIERGGLSRPRFMGTLYCEDREVDRVHFGLVFGAYTSGRVMPRDGAIASGGMISLEDIANDPLKNNKWETWSKILLPKLPKIWDEVKPK